MEGFDGVTAIVDSTENVTFKDVDPDSKPKSACAIASAFGCRPSPNSARIWASLTGEPAGTAHTSAKSSAETERACAAATSASDPTPEPAQRPGDSPLAV